jgi:hypothetical protein
MSLIQNKNSIDKIDFFAAAFAVIYVIAVEQNWALVTYHPKINEWDWLTQPARTSGPAMYWYGWLCTATLGAIASSLIALPFVRRWTPPLWLGWAIPLSVMVIFLYLLRSFFLR